MPSRQTDAPGNSAEIDELLDRSDTVFRETRLAMQSPTAENLQAAGDRLDEIIESSTRIADRLRSPRMDDGEVKRITASTDRLVESSK